MRGFSDEGGASQAPAFLTPMSQSEGRKQSWPYKKGGEFGKIIILQNGILSTMCAWARSSIFWNWERLTTHCSWFRAVWLDDVQESVGMAVLAGFRRSTAKTWPICSAQPYGPVLHVSRNLFSFCFCFYLWCCFLSFYIGWILDLPGIEIYSICPPQDSCGTASLAKIFFFLPARSTSTKISNFHVWIDCSWMINCLCNTIFLKLIFVLSFLFFSKNLEWERGDQNKKKREERKKIS
jgi:hypothetical protein